MSYCCSFQLVGSCATDFLLRHDTQQFHTFPCRWVQVPWVWRWSNQQVFVQNHPCASLRKALNPCQLHRCCCCHPHPDRWPPSLEGTHRRNAILLQQWIIYLFLLLCFYHLLVGMTLCSGNTERSGVRVPFVFRLMFSNIWLRWAVHSWVY